MKDLILTQEEAKQIISTNKKLQKQYSELLPFYKTGELDNSFELGNFFSLYDAENDVVSPNEIVIQWLDNSDNMHELVVDSLEVCVVVLDQITNA